MEKKRREGWELRQIESKKTALLHGAELSIRGSKVSSVSIRGEFAERVLNGVGHRQEEENVYHPVEDA